MPSSTPTRRAGVLALLFALASLLIVSIGLGWYFDGKPVLQLPLAIVVIALAVDYVEGSWRSRTSRSKSSEIEHGGLARLPASVEELADKAGGGSLAAAQALLFARTLLSPRDVFARVSEHLQLYHRSTKIRANYTVNLDIRSLTPGKTDFVIPLFSTDKGRILDGLRVTDGGSKRVSTLDSFNHAVFTAAVVRKVIHSPGSGVLGKYISSGLEADVWKLISSPLPPPVKKVRTAMERVRNLGGSGQPGVKLVIASELIRRAASQHFISVLIPVEHISNSAWPHAHRFAIERRVLPPVENSPQQSSRSQRVLDNLREALGVRLNRVFYDARAAFKARSYHLVIEGPEGTYLGAHEVLQSDGAELSAHINPRLGQRRSHIYITGASGRGPVFAAANFFERAPGSFAPLVLSSLAATLVIALLAVQESAIRTVDVPREGTWLLPALLTIPLAVSTLSGIDSTRLPRHPSLLSRALNFSTIGICLAAFALASLRDYVGASSLIGWSLLPLIGVALCIVSITSWIMRLALESHFVRGHDGLIGKAEN